MCRLPAESFGQVFPIGELGVVHVEWTAICTGLENVGFIEGFVHVRIHTFGCWEDEIVSGHSGLHDVCIHTYPRLMG